MFTVLVPYLYSYWILVNLQRRCVTVSWVGGGTRAVRYVCLSLENGLMEKFAVAMELSRKVFSPPD